MRGGGTVLCKVYVLLAVDWALEAFLWLELFQKNSIGLREHFGICAVRVAQSPHGRNENVIVAVFVIELGEQCLQLIGWGAFVRGGGFDCFILLKHVLVFLQILRRILKSGCHAIIDFFHHGGIYGIRSFFKVVLQILWNRNIYTI